MKQRRARGWMLHGGLVGTLIAAGSAGLGGCGDDGGEAPPPVTVVTGAGAGDVGGQGGAGGAGGAGGEGGQNAGPILAKSSKSSTIAISDDDAYVVTANADDGSISVFATEDDTRVAKLDVGNEPSAVVIHPDGVTAYVANRADATVVEVTGLRGSPAAGSPVAVGSEPTGLALSPSGRTLFVAEWAEGRISVIDTATMTVTGTIDGPEHPRGIAVTNDGDDEDADEVLVVPEFFGEAQPGGEVQDDGRRGKIRTYSVADNQALDPIELAPLDSGFSVMTSPNQLYGVAIAGDKLYFPSVSASPEGPPQFNQNVQPVLYVATLSERAEDDSNVGTTNLAQLVRDDIEAGQPRQFLADTVDIAMVGDIAYVLSRGTNVVQRVTFNAATGVEIGSAFNDQIDVGPAPAGAPAGCLVPDGIATSHASKRAYVNCRASRRLGVIDLELQEQVTTVETSNPPATPTEIAENRGFRFFHTARARWSDTGWSDCASCHPDGLTDNMTWAFAAGPRQSTSLDGSYSKGAGPQQQRVFNWTGIFDEIHDFERNTRGVSGGLGAVTQSANCGTLSEETPSAVPGPPTGLLGTPVKEIQDTQANNCTTDWDDIEAWVRTIRPPKALQSLPAADVAAGAQLFLDGGCDSCHSGAGFTVSRRFFEPSTATNTSLLSTTFPASGFPAGFPAAWNEHTTEIGLEPGTNAAPLQVACAIRNIGTFGVPGNTPATDALELRANGAGAQGSKGYNVPSLYGLAVGAPYFHHGQAPTLRDVLADPKWTAHLQAGNAVFVPTDTEIDQLVAYLLTIDEAADEVATPAGFDVCRTTFP